MNSIKKLSIIQSISLYLCSWVCVWKKNTHTKKEIFNLLSLSHVDYDDDDDDKMIFGLLNPKNGII